ncbi:MAG: diguanylate cyclase [Acholeplasmataceae bacterium]|nr:diguanylate cyclase [Acholeplasmataceae bacterium]
MQPVLVVLNLYFFIAILLVVFVSSYTVTRRGTDVAKFLLLLSIFTLFHTSGYLIEINSTQIENILFWNQIQYLGIPFATFAWIMLAISYTTKKKVPKKYVVVFSVIPIIIFLARLTNVWHGLFYTSIHLNYDIGFPTAVFGKGFFYYIQASYILLIVLIVNVIYLINSRKSTSEAKSVAARMLIASFLPWVSTIMLISPLASTGLDFTALMYPISVIIILGAVTKNNFLSIKPIARQRVFENAVDGILVFDTDMMLIDVNHAAEKIITNVREYITRPFDILCNELDELCSFYDGKKLSDFKIKDQYYQVVQKKLRDVIGQPVGHIITFTDVTESIKTIEALKENSERITYLSQHDQLTGLYNRRFLDTYLSTLKDEDHPFAIIYFDLNNLKEVNDSFGHIRGDQLIQRVAKLLIDAQSNDDVITARVGGDEFIMIIPKSDEKEALKISESLGVKFDDLYVDDLKTPVAMGYAIKTAPDSFDKTFIEAEDAMYENKKSRKSI